jgi:hypothetical protein
MKIEEARLVIEPRSVGACIDLACLFLRTHAAKVLGQTLMLVVPSSAITYYVAATMSGGWLVSIGLYLFLSPFLGAAIVAGAGHWVFGEPFTIAGSLKTVAARFWSLVYFLLLSRTIVAVTGVTCWGVFVVPLETRYGFLQEIVLLEQLRGRHVGRRMGEIMSHTFWTAMGRYTTIVLFAVAVSISMFTIIDIGAGTLLGYPIVIGRTSTFFSEELFYLLIWDPLAITTLSATVWLVYPLARLAWFFCYIDARIRKEGWDVELRFRVESHRLQAAT